MEILVPALDKLSMESEFYVLEVSWIKTKIQEFVALFEGDVGPPPPVTVEEEYVCFLLTALYTLGELLVGGDDISWKSVDLQLRLFSHLLGFSGTDPVIRGISEGISLV